MTARRNPGPHRPRDRDSHVAHQADGLPLAEAESTRVEVDEVRLHALEVDRQALLGPGLGQPSRARMIFGEPLDVVVERVHPGRGDDPCLTHRAAHAVLLHRARCISSAEPAISAPSGQPSPLERHSVTVSKSDPIAPGSLRCDAAFIRRAPSR